MKNQEDIAVFNQENKTKNNFEEIFMGSCGNNCWCSCQFSYPI